MVGDHLVWQVVIGLLPSSCSGGGRHLSVLVAVVGWQQWWVAIACGCQLDEDDKRGIGFIVCHLVATSPMVTWHLILGVSDETGESQTHQIH